MRERALRASRRRTAMQGSRTLTSALALSLVLAGAGAAAEQAPPTNEQIQAQLGEVLRQNAALAAQVQALALQVQQARDEALAAKDLAGAGSAPPALPTAEAALPAVSAPAPGPTSEGGALFSRQLGRANLQLLDVSLDTLFAAGSSTADDDALLTLQGGGHDPRQRGFTVQQVELSLMGAVDPYLTGEAHLIYFLDPEGASRFELEEAFLTTQMLPFHLEEHGVQLEIGQSFTEFGRINPQHPHQWDWQDQPVILTRLFGEDGMRGPGVRVDWLTPLPWYSQLEVGMQNAKGETMVSFLAGEEVFAERAIGGRPFGGRRVDGLDDFVYLTRWVNGFDLSETLSSQLGASALFGPNGTGGDGGTQIFGTDVLFKWRPLVSDHGWPFVIFQSEFAYRRYQAASFLDCVGEDEDCVDPIPLAGRTLRDWGLYSQLLWGFRRNWAAGIRYEWAAGSGNDVMLNEDETAFEDLARSRDPFRANRHRVSPLLVFHPTEFSRLRLQYNFDHAADLADESVHSVWAGVEFLFGAHAAHSY
jgi:hypothetical protein